MALTAQEVRVAGAGHVFVAPEGTPLPVDNAALAAPWVDMGYVTTDGVTFTFSRESEDLDAWQGDKIRVLTTREPATVGFALMQTSSDVMVVAMGGGDISETSTGIFRYEPPRGQNAIRSIVVEFSDEGLTYRYCIPRAQIEGDVTYTLTRAGALTYPLTFGLLESDPKYFILSDDPAMGDGSLPGTVGGGGGVTAAVAATEPVGRSQTTRSGSIPMTARSTSQTEPPGTTRRSSWSHPRRERCLSAPPTQPQGRAWPVPRTMPTSRTPGVITRCGARAREQPPIGRTQRRIFRSPSTMAGLGCPAGPP